MPATDKKPEPGKRYVSFLSSIQHAFSRGSVHIATSDPFAPPSIDLNALDNDIDMELMLEGMKYVRKIVSTYGKVITQEIHPGPNIRSDEQFKEVIRDTTMTVFHPVGTASMLPREDGGVVDDHLKVYGTANLRVVRIFLFPKLQGSNQVLTRLMRRFFQFMFRDIRWLQYTLLLRRYVSFSESAP